MADWSWALADTSSGTNEESSVSRPELHQAAFLCLPWGSRVTHVMILVHKRVQILEVLNTVACVEVGLDGGAGMHERIALSGHVEQV